MQTEISYAHRARSNTTQQKYPLRKRKVALFCHCRRLTKWSFELTPHPPELVAAAKARLAELEQEAEKLRDLISFYEDRPVARERRVVSSRVEARAGTRALSRTWSTVLDIVAEHGERGASYDQIIDAAARRGLDVSRNVLRSQMGNFAKRHLVESVATGVWRAMNAGSDEASRSQQRQENSKLPRAEDEGETRGEVGALFTS